MYFLVKVVHKTDLSELKKKCSEKLLNIITSHSVIALQKGVSGARKIWGPLFCVPIILVPKTVISKKLSL